MPLPFRLISFNGQAYKPISLAQNVKAQSQGEPFIIKKIITRATYVELKLQSMHDLEGVGLKISVSKQVAEDLYVGSKVLLENLETSNANDGNLTKALIRGTSDINILLSELLVKGNPVEISLVYAFAKRKLPIDIKLIQNWKKFAQITMPTLVKEHGLIAGSCAELSLLGCQPFEKSSKALLTLLLHQWSSDDVGNLFEDSFLFNYLADQKKYAEWYLSIQRNNSFSKPVLYRMNQKSGAVVVSLVSKSDDLVFFSWKEPMREQLRWYSTNNQHTRNLKLADQLLKRFSSIHSFLSVSYITEEEVFDGFSIYNPSTILKSVDLEG